jgi:phosphopantetheinyl transferase (holo-ACP synthase)
MSGAVWCAKEAVYKYFSAQGVKYPDFLNDIRVVASDLSRGELRLAAGADSLVDVRVEWTSDGLIVASVGI